MTNFFVRAKERFRALRRKSEPPPEADPEVYPMGTGKPNRHGMPRLPIGQRATQKWPVLHWNGVPTIERWELVLEGACAQPLRLSLAEFLALEQVQDTSDFHCVTTWSRFDVPWVGVRLSHLAGLCQLLPSATHLMCHGYDGYETNLSLEQALLPDVLLVHSADGAPLSPEHGGPVRVVTPRLYAWKGAKWVRRLEFMEGDRPGYWERNGYSNSADPWRDDRFSS